jgi:glycosyltransferase involved in cell wall biosynthesis
MSSIAVVMATFNGEEWLETQLQSIASQTRLPEQLIISDDGSTDHTIEIAMKFAKSAPFDVQLLEGPQKGNGENFWFAGKHAQTDIIAWCDQDDYWFPQKLQVCEHYMESYQVQSLSHSARVTDENLTPTARLFPHYKKTCVFEPLMGDPWWVAPGFTMMVRVDFLQSLRWEDRPLSHFCNGLLGHDDIIQLLAFSSGRRMQVSDVLAKYRQHRQNVAGAPRVNGFFENIKIALNSDPSQYSDLASFAVGYEKFIAACEPLNAQAIGYFARMGSRCLRRSRIHQSQNRTARARRFVNSLGRGDFGRRKHGGFGLLALARDAVSIGLPVNQVTT